MGRQHVNYVEIKYFCYINSFGITYRIIIFQVGENSNQLSNITYTLIASNIISHEEVPKGFKFDIRN